MHLYLSELQPSRLHAGRCEPAVGSRMRVKGWLRLFFSVGFTGITNTSLA